MGQPELFPADVGGLNITLNRSSDGRWAWRVWVRHDTYTERRWLSVAFGEASTRYHAYGDATQEAYAVTDWDEERY